MLFSGFSSPLTSLVILTYHSQHGLFSIQGGISTVSESVYTVYISKLSRCGRVSYLRRHKSQLLYVVTSCARISCGGSCTITLRLQKTAPVYCCHNCVCCSNIFSRFYCTQSIRR